MNRFIKSIVKQTIWLDEHEILKLLLCMSMVLTGYLFLIHIAFIYTPLVLMVLFITHRSIATFNIDKYKKEYSDE
jgi:hypothetical protein